MPLLCLRKLLFLWLLCALVVACGQEPVGDRCVGVRPAAGGPSPGKVTCESAKACVGEPAPRWSLEDFQPQSCGYQQRYGMDSFQGQVTLVVLLSAWCGYCQRQAEQLERLRLEWELAKKNVQVLVINSSDADKDQSKLVERCSFPLFQDTGNQAWGALKGKKDDFFLYDRRGTLLQYFSSTDPKATTDLSTDEGYKRVKDAVEAALKQEPT